MTGRDISTTVNRAFMIFGGIFVLGGLYLGSLMFLSAPEIYTVNGRIESVRVEKSRPFGFEDIPVDSDDPEHAGIPINITSYGVISYSFEGREYETEIMSWYEDNDWETGQYRSFYLVEDELDIPHESLPGEILKGKQQALIIGIIMSVSGAVFLSISIWQVSSEKKKRAELVSRVRKLKKQNYIPLVSRSGKVLLEVKSTGNLMIGIIVTVVGAVFFAVGVMEFLTQSELQKKLMLAFPALIGAGLLFAGLSEFYKDIVTVSSREVRCTHRALWGSYDDTRKTSSFAGIDENILEHISKGGFNRRIYKELVLVHEDSRFDKVSLKLIPDDEKSLSASREIAESLGLPRIIHDGTSLNLEYPEEKISLGEETEKKDGGWSPADPFPGKYLKLVRFEESELEMTRPFGRSILWGSVILGLGVFIAIWANTAAVLFPFVMMNLIFTGVGLKKEVFTVSDGKISVKRSFAAKVYSRQEFPLADIQEIKIGTDVRMNSAECLEINGSEDRILFGQSAGINELEWLKNCIIYLKSQ